MPTVSVTRSYLDETPLLEVHIDDFLDDFETFLNVTQIDDANINDATITASTKLVNGSITSGKINAGAVTEAKIATGAVETAKIADEAVTNAKFAADNITTAKLASSSITSSLIAASQLTTAKFADDSITKAKRANDDNTTSKGANTYSGQTSSTSFQSVVSQAITTTGRSVLVQFDDDGSGAGSQITWRRNALVSGFKEVYVEYRFKRDGTVIAVFGGYASVTGAGNAFYDLGISVPSAALWTVDTPSSGAHTYALEMRVSGIAGEVGVGNSGLILSEIH